MISTEHLRAEPYIYRTVPYIYRTEPNHHIPARKINRTVPYRGYVRLSSANRTESMEKCTVRYDSVRIAHSVPRYENKRDLRRRRRSSSIETSFLFPARLIAFSS